MANGKRNPVRYHDVYFRLAAALAGALLATEFGSTKGLWERLLSPLFYKEFGASLIIALVLIESIAWATRILDRNYRWEERPLVRAMLQVLLGVFVPALVDFFMATVYFRVYGLNILEDTNYIIYALPFIIMMILLFNLYYVCYYFILRARQNQSFANSTQEESTGRELFVVAQGARNIPIPVDEISYFYREDEYNYLMTFTGDSYLIPQSLEDIEAQLDSCTFFRINRQMIIHYKSCEHFEPASYGKLKLFLEPSFTQKDVIVSQRRVKGFKEMPVQPVKRAW